MNQNKLSADPSALILGIIGLMISFAGCCCGIFAVVSIVLGIIGLVMANKSINEYKTNPESFSRISYNNVFTSKILNIISIVVGAVITLAYIVYFLAYGVLISEAIDAAYEAKQYEDDYNYGLENDTIYNDNDYYVVEEDTINTNETQEQSFEDIMRDLDSKY